MSFWPARWYQEDTGVLKPCVERYLFRNELEEGDIDRIREYLEVFMGAEFWEEDRDGWEKEEVMSLRRQVGSIGTRRDIDIWTERAAESRIDPWA